MKKYLSYALIGFIAGIGALSPGLSGASILVVFGLYPLVLKIIANPKKEFLPNILFLVVFFSSALLGVVLFSKIISYHLTNNPGPTRYLFLGLLLGTLPSFFYEANKEKRALKFAPWGLIGVGIGLIVIFFRPNAFAQGNIFLYMLSGLVVGLALIIPGLDTALTLESLGLYELFVGLIADFSANLLSLFVMGIFIILALLLSAKLVNYLLKKHYSPTFFVFLGIFLTLMPSIIFDESCRPAISWSYVFSLSLTIIGCALTFLLAKYTKRESLESQVA
jgi:putative membrane protein